MTAEETAARVLALAATASLPVGRSRMDCDDGRILLGFWDRGIHGFAEIEADGSVTFDWTFEDLSRPCIVIEEMDVDAGFAAFVAACPVDAVPAAE